MNLNDFVIDLNEANQEDIERIHEISKTFRELADLFDQLVIKGKTKEELEEIGAKIIFKYLKLQGGN